MAWFKRTYPLPPLPPSNQPGPVDLNQALETILVKSVESQASLAGKISEMIAGSIGQLAQAQQEHIDRVRARRGGRKRAATGIRSSNGMFLPMVKGCRLCRNPGVHNPTPSEIIEHQKHELMPAVDVSEVPPARPRTPPPPINSREVIGPERYFPELNADRYAVNETDIQTAPDGTDVVECPECSKGIPHEHGSN